MSDSGHDHSPDGSATPATPATPAAATTRRAGRGASVALLLGLIVLGFLMTSAAQQSRPGPRLARTDRLVSLIRLEDRRTTTLRRELDSLKKDVSNLETVTSGRAARLAQIRALADGLLPYAGLAAVHGPGLRIELRDSTLRDSPTGDPNDLVIHEQDLQAVVNALLAGGAEAVAVNGERITTLSAIRCVGNTLLLHGSVYSPPYRLAAIGSFPALSAALDADDGVERLRIVADKFKLGFDVTRADRISAPAFRGIAVLRFAKLAG